MPLRTITISATVTSDLSDEDLSKAIADGVVKANTYTWATGLPEIKDIFVKIEYK